MADSNGFISSGDPRVDAALKRLQEKNDARFKDLEDAVLVQAHLEASAGRRLKEHAELLADHQDAVKEHGSWIKEQRELNKATDKRIADLVSAIGELIAKQNKWD